MELKKRPPTEVERITAKVNEVLGQRGCSYCRRYYKAEMVRKTRNRFGTVKWICTGCEERRKTRQGKGE